MTKGKLLFLLQDRLITSCVFEGEMFENGHYEEAVNRLLDVKSPANFIQHVTSFDLMNFNYQAQGKELFSAFRTDSSNDEMISILIREACKGVDYGFIKNGLKRKFKFHGNEQTTEIRDEYVFVLYFGRLYKKYQYKIINL